MPAALRLEADLAFSIETPASDTQGASLISGSVRAIGSHVEVKSDELMAIAGQPSRAEVRRVAAEVARYGLTVIVRGPDGIVVTLGLVGSAPFSRLVTRSPYMKIGSLKQGLMAVRARRRSAPGAVKLEAAELPPGTMWPVLPTLLRRSRVVTTTHDPSGGGEPRLYLADKRANGGLGVFYLKPGVTKIGSGDDVDLRLEGLDELHAEIIRADNDEYVLVARSTRLFTTVAGKQLPRQTLHTGSRVELGPWRMSYVRDEYADHGRPYGGRIGGELGRQRTQPRPQNHQGGGF
ncbi:FHA domain-containing protein [Aeromicrobium sp.]|uniref:FHA domain-containing protein n=1 Tax=Aeromicrobium sp. TaxID=1871063 RepID=UPI0019865ADC|nr:FHA domain-containing protein [Aeromicrobium sp.]MBC7633437.1 FHA domain-containing protein [Aeromicrobium sp.]